MTAHVQDPSMPVDEAVDTHPGDTRAGRTSTRPRWLMPGIAAGVGVAGLVLAGVVPFSTALYAAMFGGMLVMHLGGHGMHGGHAGHANGGSSARPAPSKPQPGSRAGGPGSSGEAGDEAPDEGRGDEAQRHDQRGSRGCH